MQGKAGTSENPLEKVLVGDGCWEWTGSRNPKGYGRTLYQGRQQQAHRVVFEILARPVPDGLELDHLCRNRGCVRPDHLEPVTHAENVRRAKIARPRLACPKGHTATPDNTYRYPDGKVDCVPCRRARRLANRMKMRVANA